jgi:cell division protein FtsQ
MPLSQNFTASVLAVNGYIDELFANKVDSLHTRWLKRSLKRPILSGKIRFGMRR